MESRFKTYGLQVVVFLSFLALFSLIIAGIVIYGYQSNLEIMLQSSDELLYQISETISRQINSHLEPANKNGVTIKNLIERNIISSSTIEFNQSFFNETLETYPQFQSIYFGDESGNYFMTYRDEDDFVTKIIDRTSSNPGTRLIRKSIGGEIISDTLNSTINFDPRERPWYYNTKSSQKSIWTSEYFLFTAMEPGVTCAQPLFDENDNFKGAVGIDFKLNEINGFLKSLKIGERGTAFICDSNGNIFAHPVKLIHKNTGAKSGRKNKQPRPPVEQILETGPERNAIDTFLSGSGRYKFNFTHKSDSYIATFRSLSKKFGSQWTLGIIVPEDDFIGPIARIHETTLLFSFWLLIIAGFLTATLAKELTDPIHKAISEANRIQKLDFEGEVDLQSPITEIQNMSDTMNSMKKALSAFKKYVPSEIVQELVRDKNEAKLEAKTCKLTILFTDIANFSSISEKTDPQELVIQLSEYFDAIAKIIHKYDGTIDKYIGDSVMAFWGAPLADSQQANKACLAAIEIENSIKHLNVKWTGKNRNPFLTRIGINTGLSLVGNFGSSDRFNYTAIGDSVNLASRLESLNKLYSTEIIVSEATRKEADSSHIFRVLDIVAVKGRQQSVTVYQLMGTTKSDNAKQLKELSLLSEKALVYYLSSQWEEAIEAFKQILALYPKDIPAQMFIERCHKLKEHPTDNDWDGVYRLRQK